MLGVSFLLAAIASPAIGGELLRFDAATGYRAGDFSEGLSGVDSELADWSAIPVRLTRKSEDSVEAKELLPRRLGGVDLVLSWSLRISSPQLLSASLGVVIGPSECEEIEICSPQGVLVQVEPGVGGGKVSLGYASVSGLAIWKNWFLTAPLGGFDLKASFLESWGPSLLVAPRQGFLGVETDFTVFLVKVSLGVLARVHGDADGDSWMITGGMGLGF